MKTDQHLFSALGFGDRSTPVLSTRVWDRRAHGFGRVKVRRQDKTRTQHFFSRQDRRWTRHCGLGDRAVQGLSTELGDRTVLGLSTEVRKQAVYWDSAQRLGYSIVLGLITGVRRRTALGLSTEVRRQDSMYMDLALA